MSNSIIIKSYFLLFFITSFDIVFDENIPIPVVYSTLKIFDEVYILLLFIYTICTSKVRNNNNVFYLVLIFFIVGVIGNYISNSSLKVTLLGSYSTIKSILLFWSLSQYDFNWDDFSCLKKMIMTLFPIVAISYLLDILIPTFRQDIGIVSQAEDIRMGIRSLGGLFNRFTNATLFALLFYIFSNYYFEEKKQKYKPFMSIFMFFSTLKVKDILGYIIAYLTSRFNTIKIKHLVITIIVLYMFFILYQILMPEHYDNYFNSDADGNIARVVLVYTSIQILINNFPFGVGFGMFASPTSQQIESPIYQHYNIDNVYGLNYDADGGCFMSDTFWPMIFGETGVLGTIIYVIILYKVFGPFIVGFLNNTSDKRYIMPAFIFLVFLGASIGKPVFSGPPHCLAVWGIAGIFSSLSKKNI